MPPTVLPRGRQGSQTWGHRTAVRLVAERQGPEKHQDPQRTFTVKRGRKHSKRQQLRHV